MRWQFVASCLTFLTLSVKLTKCGFARVAAGLRATLRPCFERRVPVVTRLVELLSVVVVVSVVGLFSMSKQEINCSAIVREAIDTKRRCNWVKVLVWTVCREKVMCSVVSGHVARVNLSEFVNCRYIFTDHAPPNTTPRHVTGSRTYGFFRAAS